MSQTIKQPKKHTNVSKKSRGIGRSVASEIKDGTGAGYSPVEVGNRIGQDVAAKIRRTS